MTPTSIKFKRDNHTRSQLFDANSFQHQGKANLYLLLAIMGHLPSAGIVLDPMAGTGSALVYTDYGYQVITGELEAHWAVQCETNRQTITGRRLFANQTPALCCQWEAGRLPLADGSIAGLVTSPPYADMLSDWHINSNNLQDAGHPEFGIAYGLHPQNLGNVHIYEDYLSGMFSVYRECWRVLRTGGIMALVIKDRVHKGHIIPITQDAITIAGALGFSLIDKIERRCIPSLHRNVHAQRNPLMPQVNVETALIFKKTDYPPRRMKIALIQSPPPNEPGWTLFKKAVGYSKTNRLILDHSGVIPPGYHRDYLTAPAYTGFRKRKLFSFKCVSDLVLKHGLAAGSHIELHVNQQYATYLTQRLTTLGMTVTNPTEGLNLGQKLKFYTENNYDKTNLD